MGTKISTRLKNAQQFPPGPVGDGEGNRANQESVERVRAEPWMQAEALETLGAVFMQNLKDMIPVLCAKMKLYLTDKSEEPDADEQLLVEQVEALQPSTQNQGKGQPSHGSG